jgi:hypothetical protein
MMSGNPSMTHQRSATTRSSGRETDEATVGIALCANGVFARDHQQPTLAPILGKRFNGAKGHSR